MTMILGSVFATAGVLLGVTNARCSGIRFLAAVSMIAAGIAIGVVQ